MLTETQITAKLDSLIVVSLAAALRFAASVAQLKADAEETAPVTTADRDCATVKPAK